MNRIIVGITLVMVLCIPLAAPAAAAPLRCAQCGMMVSESSPFSARIVADGKTADFCDIGDMLLSIKEKKAGTTGAQVKDYVSGAWISASEAFFVHAPKKFSSPMGWSIASFRDKAEAAKFGDTEDLSAILKRIK